MLLIGADVGSLLADEFGETEESDAVCLVKGANILRRNSAEHLLTLERSFEPYCQQMSIPTSSHTLISMLLLCPNISKQIHPTSQKHALKKKYDYIRGLRWSKFGPNPPHMLITRPAQCN